MCCLQSQEQWPSGYLSDGKALSCGKASHLRRETLEATPIRYSVHRHPESDAEAFAERYASMDPPSVYHPNTSRASQCNTDVDLLPDNIPSTPGTFSSTTANLPSKQGDNVMPVTLLSPETRVFPISVSDFQRYEGKFTRSKHCNAPYHIKAKTTSFSPNSPPAGWTPLVHPEGAPFFHDEGRRIFTDADLYDMGVYTVLEESARTIESRIRSSSTQLPQKFDIVLDLRQESPGRYNCGYYLANHDNRTIFWLDDHDVCGILNEVNIHYTLSHVGHEIESQFWYHCELFPNTCSITKDVLLELKDILTYNIGDCLTSSVSNAPYSVEELRQMLHLANEMKDQVDMVSPGSVCTFSRLMSTFAHERFLNLHGEPGARLCRDQSIHGGSLLHQRTSIFKWINPVMFYVPSVHLRTLCDNTIDHLVNKSRSSQILAQLKSEWRDATIFSSLLLNANIMLLVTRDSLNPQSVSQRMNQVSVLINIGSLIAGLLLSRQASNGKFNHFLAQRSVCSFGLEALAMMYSLPNALLLWGATSFFAALGITCIDGDSMISYSLNGVACVALISIFAWCISTSSESGPYVQPWILRKLRDQYPETPSLENEAWGRKGF